MRRLIFSIPVILALASAGCSSYDDRQWLKVDREVHDGRIPSRPHRVLKNGKLDDNCMRSRGWVAVNPTTKAEGQPRDPNASPLGAPVKGGRY